MFSMFSALTHEVPVVMPNTWQPYGVDGPPVSAGGSAL
jgi:hypothetical protein